MAKGSPVNPPWLPQAYPFRQVDRVLERDPPRRCVTLKVFSADELLLEGSDTVPPSLVLEALCQSAACLEADGTSGEGRILRIEEAILSGKVKPGDRLIVSTTLLEQGALGLRAESVGEVEGKQVARLRVFVRSGRPPA